MLCNSTCRLLLLKAFTASTKRVATIFNEIVETKVKFCIWPSNLLISLPHLSTNVEFEQISQQMFWLNEFNFVIWVGRGFSLNFGKLLRIFEIINLSQLISLMIVVEMYNRVIPLKLDIIDFLYQYNSIYILERKEDFYSLQMGRRKPKNFNYG